MHEGTCSVGGCDATMIVAREMCESHYRRWLRENRDIVPPTTRPTKNGQTIEERFWARVEKTESCWIWTGATDKNGYGGCWSGASDVRGVMLAHRFSYEQLVGPIPDGLTLDHLCRNPPCVNPAHLEPVTASENSRRAAAAQTHCKHGHEFTPENTYRNPRGYRFCRTCKRLRWPGYRDRRRARKLAARNLAA